MPSTNKKFNWFKDRDNWPFWYRGYSLRYAPIKAIKYWFGNLRAFFRRGRLGWAYGDAWDIDMYIGKVLPEMLRHMANEGMGCPMQYIDKHPDDEEAGHQEWKNDLIHCAELIEFAASDRDDHNPFAKDWLDIILERDINDPCDDVKELRECYKVEDLDIYARQQEAIKEAFAWLGENFYDLWD